MLLNQVVYGQTQNRKESFPSYNQIKPKAGEIIDYDYVSKNGEVAPAAINLFDYPPGTVTYIINGKPTKVKYVKQMLSDNRNRIDSLSISQPDLAGKRTIKIKYEQL